MAGRKSSCAKAIFSSPAFVLGSARNKPGCRRQLLLEALEDRCVPSTITPTTFADGGSGSGSLRDAVLQFNADTGTDDDTIQLEAGTYALTITNTSGHHETAGLKGDLNITNTSHRLIIQGAGSSGDNRTVIDASQLQDRAFQVVNSGTEVVFQDLVIKGGLAQDDGADGAAAGSTDARGVASSTTAATSHSTTWWFRTTWPEVVTAQPAAPGNQVAMATALKGVAFLLLAARSRFPTAQSRTTRQSVATAAKAAVSSHMEATAGLPVAAGSTRVMA
jgi:hypothetical protein